MQQMLWIFVAILIVLALIGATAWLVRRFGGGSIGSGSARGRMPRLAVIDAAAVDGRRRLVLVRRDNVEHLLMIGGPSDIVVEPNIVRNAAQRDAVPQRAPAGTELPPRIAPLPDANWQDAEPPARADVFDFPEPSIAAERPARPAFADDARRPAPIERARTDEAANLVPEPVVRPEPRVERTRPAPAPVSVRVEPAMPRMPRSADMTPKAPAAAPLPRATPRAEPAPSAADQNLAEMAQRLEAALRRPGNGPARTEPEAKSVAINPADRVGAPPVAPEATVAPPPPAAAPAQRPAFESLEDEMASLLGRPKNQT